MANKKQRRPKEIASSAGVYVLLVFFLLFTIMPIIWLGSIAFKTHVQAFADPPVFIFKPTMEHVQALFNSDFPKFFLNSLTVASMTTILCLIIGTPAAWGMLRLDNRFSRGMFLWILIVRMAPAMTYVIPFFIVFSKLHLIDTRFGLILAYFTFNLPVVIWVMRSFLIDLPQSLEESATIDGATAPQIFLRIIAPISTPGLVSTGILTFIICWNEFIFALVLTRRNVATAPIGILNMMTHEGTDWGQMGAAGLLVILPAVLFAAFVGKHIAQGLTGGAVKG